MITAAEAYAASLTRDELGAKQELEYIRNKIGQAIQVGEYSCYIPRRYLLPVTIKALKRLGYKVKAPHGSGYTISWR